MRVEKPTIAKFTRSALTILELASFFVETVNFISISAFVLLGSILLDMSNMSKSTCVLKSLPGFIFCPNFVIVELNCSPWALFALVMLS